MICCEALHPPVVSAAENPAVVHQHRPDRDPALGEPRFGFRNRGSQEGVHEYKEYAKLIVSPADEHQRVGRGGNVKAGAHQTAPCAH